jgi:membrane-bound ClpP family serine protease
LRLKYGFASHLAADQKQLAEALQVPPEQLEQTVDAGDAWKAFRVNLRGRITSRLVTESMQAIRSGLESDANLICLYIDSPGGVPAPTLRLLNFLAEQDPQRVKTVAYVANEALSVAALAALGCDEMFIEQDAMLGGPGDAFLGPGELDDLRVTVREVARAKGRDWSLMYAMVDPDMQVTRYRRAGTGEVRYFGEAELAEQTQPDQWERDGILATGRGVSGNEAVQLRLARDTAEDFASVTRQLNIDEEIKIAERNTITAAIERLAGQPWFARTLLFVAFFALITEASAPGIGVAGFVSGLCFLLFFWSQFLNGTSGWLEVTLFVGGLVCIALEIFVLPGFGVFGVGGGAMVLTSIVLASQTFIIPRNSYQFDQMPSSLFTAVVAGGGIVAAAWIVRRYLPDAPIVRLLMLRAPDDDEVEELDVRESLVDWHYLMGKRGITTTQLTPSGKAKFGDEVIGVISDGVLVEPGIPVVVSEVRGNLVLVEPLEEG